MKKNAKKQICDLLKLENGKLDPKMKIGDGFWDSLNHLTIMIILENEFQIEINEENMRKFQDMSAIIEIIDKEN